MLNTYNEGLQKLNNNMQKETAFQQLEELLSKGVIENEKEIIALMIANNITLPQILAREVSRDDSPRRKIFKAICDLTGYSLVELPINQEQKNRVEEKYPDICKGCSNRMQAWAGKFIKATQESTEAKQTNATLL